MKNLLILLFIIVLSGCGSDDADELCPGADNPSVPCSDPPVSVNLLGNEYITESINETSLIGAIRFEIKDVGPAQGVESKQAKMVKTCTNCNGVTTFGFDGNAVDISLSFDSSSPLGYSLSDFKERFADAEITMYFPDLQETKGRTHYATMDIGTLDTTLPDGRLTFTEFSDGKLKGEITGIVDEIVECTGGETPAVGCTKFNNTSVEYVIKFEFTMEG